MYDDLLPQRLHEVADGIKYGDLESIDLDSVHGLLRQAATCIRDLSSLLPDAQEFRYSRHENGVVEVRIKTEMDERALSTLLSFLAEHV